MPYSGALLAVLWSVLLPGLVAAEPIPIRAGVSRIQITPPPGYPMAGYFHERLAEGELDPLYTRALVLRQGQTSAALIVCDLIGVTTDFYETVRQRVAQQTGMSADHIVLSATHTHTAPDYAAAFAAWMQAGQPPLAEISESPETFRIRWIALLVERTVQCAVQAFASAQEVQLLSGWTEQQTPVAFNRRFLQRDGSVRTWVGLKHPETLRSAGPEDPQLPLLLLRPDNGGPQTVLSNFALHLDTVGGNRWSADFPGAIGGVIRDALGPQSISIFGTGCCGDINHVNPDGGERNQTAMIGASLGQTIVSGLQHLSEPEDTELRVAGRVVHLPLRPADSQLVSDSLQVLRNVAAGETVSFDDHVRARRVMMLDQLRNNPRLAADAGELSPALTSTLAGVGDTLPVRIHAISIGKELAVVCLPGEVFVELGLAIRRASPFRTTMLIELSNCVETYYVPTRAAYAGGGYEPNNSTLLPGGGELLVEESIRLLQQLVATPDQP